MMAVWSCSSTKHAAVAQWAANTVYGAGAIVRQLAAPAAGSERCFRTAAGGTSHAATEPTWVLTKGAAQPADGTVADWTEITGNSTYGWAVAHARLRNALAWMAAGDTVYVGDDSAATEAAVVTFTSPGTSAAPCYILCVNDSAWPPTALAATATESTTGASNISFAGVADFYGTTFVAGNSTNAADILVGTGSKIAFLFDNCRFTLGGNSASSDVIFGNAATIPQFIRLRNTSLTLSNASNRIIIRGQFVWENTANALAGTIPTTVFSIVSFYPHYPIVFRGVDLSAAGAGKTLFNVATTGGQILLDSCKLGSEVVLLAGTNAGLGGVEVRMRNSDSGDTNYRYRDHNYCGDIYDESTIVRTGGATDSTTPISRKMVSSASAKYVFPLVLESMAVWNEATGSEMTLTIHVVTDNVTLTDAEAWVEVEYPSDANTPQSSLLSDRSASILATPVNQTTSTETWTTTGLGAPVKQKFSVAFTPQQKGLINARVMLAKASTTVYVCPKMELA